MPIEFRCQNCDKLLRTPDDSGGKKGRCPHCQGVMDIPLQSTAAGESDEPTAPQNVSRPSPPPSSAPPGSGGGSSFGGSSTGGSSSSATPGPFDEIKPEESSSPFGDSGSSSSGSSSGSPFSNPPASGSSGGNPYARNPYAGNNPYASTPATSGSGGSGYTKPHRGTLVFVLGLISLLLSLLGCILCITSPISFGLGLTAWLLANPDVNEMHSGAMDPTGLGMTNAGRVLGIIGVVLSVLTMILFFCVIMASALEG